MLYKTKVYFPGVTETSMYRQLRALIICFDHHITNMLKTYVIQRDSKQGKKLNPCWFSDC